GFIFARAPEEFHLNAPLAVASGLGAIAGFGAGLGVYAGGWLDPARLVRQYAGLHRLLVNKYFLDDLYQWLIDHVALVLARLIATFDRRVINDIGVDGPAAATVQAGEQLRYHETGKLYTYAWVMAVGVIVLLLCVRA